jgi:hypothetical protein
MASNTRKRAIRSDQGRLARPSLTRFTVLGLEADRDLIRSLAQRLSEEGSDAATLRLVLNRAISADSAKKGGIFDAFLRSPLVGVDLELTRTVEQARKVET